MISVEILTILLGEGMVATGIVGREKWWNTRLVIVEIFVIAELSKIAFQTVPM